MKNKKGLLLMTVLMIPNFSSSVAVTVDGSAPAKRDVVTKSLLENVPQRLRPIGEREYAESYIKFSEELPSKEIPDLLKQCGVNSKKVLFITPQSIIEGAFKGNRERLDYFKGILNSKKKLKKAFRDFVYSTPVSEDDVMRTVSTERTESYRDYVYRAVADGLGVRAYRDRIVSFLAALEYRRTVDPEFQIQFNIFDRIEERFTEENVLLLRFEYKDGRHYSDLKRAGARLTLPFGFRENAVDFDDTYVCMHEIGHAIHNLLDINSRAIPLSVSSENAWMRKTFFPLIDVSEKAMPSFIYRAKETLKQCLAEGKSMWDYCSKSLQQANEIYRDEAHPYDADEFRRVGITKIENMLSDEKIATTLKNSCDVNDVDEELLKELIRLRAKHENFYNVWTNVEEMSQIIGISSIGNYVVVDRNADIRAFYERKKAIRWGHISFPYVLESDNKAYKVMKMFAPEDKYVESLFSLHGLDFEECKRKI